MTSYNMPHVKCDVIIIIYNLAKVTVKPTHISHFQTLKIDCHHIPKTGHSLKSALCKPIRQAKLCENWKKSEPNRKRRRLQSLNGRFKKGRGSLEHIVRLDRYAVVTDAITTSMECYVNEDRQRSVKIYSQFLYFWKSVSCGNIKKDFAKFHVR